MLARYPSRTYLRTTPGPVRPALSESLPVNPSSTFLSNENRCCILQSLVLPATICHSPTSTAPSTYPLPGLITLFHWSHENRRLNSILLNQLFSRSIFKNLWWIYHLHSYAIRFTRMYSTITLYLLTRFSTPLVEIKRFDQIKVI